MATNWTYRDALVYIYSFTDYEKKVPQAYAPEFYDLARVHRLLALWATRSGPSRCGILLAQRARGPRRRSPSLCCGRRVVLGCTPPHLHTFRERTGRWCADPRN